MENWTDFLIPLLGLLFYWLSTSKKKKSRPPADGPEEVQPPPELVVPSQKKAKSSPPPPPVYMDDDEEEELPPAPPPRRSRVEAAVEPPAEEQLSFKELLERVRNPRKYEEEQRRKYGVEKITERAAKRLKPYLPDEDFGKPMSKELLKSIKIREVQGSKKAKRPFSIKRIVKSPENIRDAFIMKEIFDRKHFPRR